MREHTLSLYKTYRLILHRYDKNVLFIDETFREDATDEEIYNFLINVIYEIVPNVKKIKFDIKQQEVLAQPKVESTINVDDILQVKYIVPNERTFVKELLINEINGKLEDFQLLPGSEQRSVGDVIEEMVRKAVLNIDNENITETTGQRSNISIEDVTLNTITTKYYIDVKTHNVGSEFSMPNLTAITKLKNEILTQNNELIYIFVDYIKDDNNIVKISDIYINYIWEIDWSVLHIQGLGLGVLQIKDKHKELKFTDIGRDLWFEILHKTVLEVYLVKQEEKIEKQKIFWKQ